MNRLSITLLLVLGLKYCVSGQTQPASFDSLVLISTDTSALAMMEAKQRLAAEMQLAQLDYFIIDAGQDRFGYYILINGHLYIEQKNIPALPLIHGFQTAADAEKVALKMIDKIRAGEMPPSITPEELTGLGIEIYF